MVVGSIGRIRQTAPIPASRRVVEQNAGGDWTAVRTIEVPDLGWDAAIVDIEGERILLVDASLSLDDRTAHLVAAATD